jgi:hypothetical protein
MFTRTAFLLAGVLLTTLVIAPRAAEAASMQLIVTPSQGHAGDPIFLSGSGFVPKHAVSIYLRCVSRSPERMTVTRANGLGRFAAVRIRLPLTQRAGRCRFSAASLATPSMRIKAHAYQVVPLGHRLAKCSAHMCLRVQAFLVRLANGARGNIVISGWPGATANVTIARTATGAKYRELRLNWRGVGSVSTPVAPGLLKGLKARVFVRAHLGKVWGQTVTPFHVMFGNR